MISSLKKLYIGWGLDIAPRDSLRGKAHNILRLFWQVVGMPYAAVFYLRYAMASSNPDPALWARVGHRALPQSLRFSLHNPQLSERPASWYHFRPHFADNAETQRYDLDRAMRAADVKGLALIYAMGMGDYFFTTPLIAVLKQRYPHLPIIAYVSQNAGKQNAPMVAELLRYNPHIDIVHMYDGHQRPFFKNYDIRDAVRQVPPHYLALPVLYDYAPSVMHRVAGLFETFGLALPQDLPKPIIPVPDKPSPHVERMLADIQQSCAVQKARGIVFLQTDARSSGYSYPHTDELVTQLNARGFYVVSVSPLTRQGPMSLQLDLTRFAMMDSIHLLKLLRDAFPQTYVVSMTSVFWSISSGLDIPNLGMYHFIDEAMHNTWYPNIHVITHHAYKRLPSSHQFVAGKNDYSLNKRSQAVFSPAFVMRCFDAMGLD